MEKSKINDSMNDFEKKLKNLQSNYIRSLSGKISEIEIIWNQLIKEQWHKNTVLKMQNLAHNLAGSAGTFGLEKISMQSKLLEQALQSLHNVANNVERKKVISEIDSLLVTLQEIELPDSQSTSVISKISDKGNVIYILDTDKELSIDISRQLMYYKCTVKVINDISNLESINNDNDLLLIIIDADFANLMLDKHNVIQTLRKDWLIDCPIVYISSQEDFESRIHAMESGANAYFSKPLDIVLLIERIHILTNAGIVEPYRILLVEDDKELAEYYALMMEQGGLTVFIENQPEFALDKILELNPELVVMDLYMPNYNGIDIIKVIRQHQSLYTLPIVLLTAENNVEMQFLAREAGVDDFLQKPITDSHLFDSVLNRLQRSRYMNITMTKDSLTGTFVHKKINEFLEMHLNISKRYNRCLSYLILDIDNFKDINDNYGHLAGDSVLVTLANFIKTNTRASDIICRYGGEEFVIISPETDEKSMLNTANKLRSGFANIKHYSKNNSFSVTFSAGIASFPKYKSVDVIMAAADKALYISKDNGRNQITIG